MKLITYLLVAIVVAVNGEFMIKTKRTVNTNDILERYQELTINQCFGRCEGDSRCSVFAMDKRIALGQHAECILLRKFERTEDIDMQENDDCVELLVYEKFNSKEISERRILKDGEFENGGNGQLIRNTQASMKKPIYYFPNLQMDWMSAENMCIQWGGHLASIHSKEEKDFLLSLQKKWINSAITWTGLNDINNESLFVWTDGSSSTYNDFKDGQPNGGTNENCVEMFSNALWYDQVCDVKFHFFCKYNFHYILSEVVGKSLPMELNM